MERSMLPRQYTEDSRFANSNGSLAELNSRFIEPEELAECNGSDLLKPTWMAIQGVIFDVTRNPAFAPGGPYHVYAGKDSSRALAISSLKAEDCVPECDGLEDVHKTVLNEWFAKFKKKYNIVGRVAPRRLVID